MSQTGQQVTEEAAVFAVTTDTDATMNKFGLILEDKEFEHMYYIDHVLHLTCKKCYIESSYSNDTSKSVVRKATNIVSFFNSLPQVTEQLKNFQKASNEYDNKKELLGLLVTCWWSMYRMCDRLIYLQHAIRLLETLPNKKKVSDDKCDKLNDIKKVLQPFWLSQIFLEG